MAVGDITLVTSATVTNPTTRAQAKPFVTNYTILSRLSRNQQLALAIYAQIVGLSGTEDYTNAHNNLIKNASVFTAGLDNIGANWDAALAASTYGGQISQNSISGDVADVLALVKDLQYLPEETLRRINIYLRYVLQN